MMLPLSRASALLLLLLLLLLLSLPLLVLSTGKSLDVFKVSRVVTALLVVVVNTE
jgi:hypothetical protein